MNQELVKLLEIYKPMGIDWMCFQITKKNPYSFHHIKKQQNGGLLILENGAILSKKSHRLLNWIEEKYPLLYLDWEELFFLINQERNFELYEKRAREMKKKSLELRYK